MAVSKQPPLSPETSSGDGLDDEISSRGEAKWKRFHPLRVVRKIFRRRHKRESGSVSDASKKSWSTSELQSVDDDGSGKCDVTSPLKIGLSVSHDSIFSPENNASGMGSETLSVPHGSSLSIHQASIKNMFKDELFSRVRARRDSDDNDVGLPHSPCTSPTTADVLSQGLKEKSSKSRTTCSAGSLISMGSSENDEDSVGQSSSGHSSRMSLIDRRSLDSEGDMELNQSVPLNHNAAHHKIAIKPKRTHGLPRRRVNQIAAAKISTLPSTPEVAEDNVKMMQKREAIEVVQSIQESRFSSDSENISLQFSERKLMHTSFSCNEMSDFTEVVIQDKTSSESNVNKVKRSKDFFKEESLKKTKAVKPNYLNSEFFNIPNYKDDFEPEFKEDKFKSSSQQSCFERQKEFVFNEAKLEDISSEFKKESFKNLFPKNESVNKSTLIDPFQSQTEEPIKVSSLVKNIEKSESLKLSDMSSKLTEENAFIFDGKNDSENKSTVQPDEQSVENKTGTLHDIISQISLSNSFNSIEHISSLDSKDQKVLSVVQDSNKLNIDCEFILKPIKKENISKNDSELVAKENIFEKESSIISPTFFDEDSIMSSKAMSMDIEEGGISISHHASIQNDLKNILVTEAHNYVAVEENIDAFMQHTTGNTQDLKQENNGPWVNSMGITTQSSDVTVNSTSNLSKSKMNEDRITISFNSKQATKYINTQPEKDDKTKVEATASINTDSSQKIAAKDKPTDKSIKPKLYECKEALANVKNTTPQKRVSVEIVPFSQRMKERKYQPITFTSKETNSDKEKKIPQTSVERKLSDRKTISKSRETEKSSGRHSFSGVISSDKKEINADKKPIKPEKIQYPVQIRIHKSIPAAEVKNSSNKPTSNRERKSSITKNVTKDENLNMKSPKLTSKDIKSLKEDKLIAENTKWEVKIQSSAVQSTNLLSNTEESNSQAITSLSYSARGDSQFFSGSENKEFHSYQEVESQKSSENSSRIQKEVPTFSDDLEPELLRVFARRSIKQKHCDKDKMNEEEKPVLDVSTEDSLHTEKNDDNDVISVSHNSTVIKILETSKPHIKHDLKKKSKSFSEKERNITRSVSPLKEINLIHRESPTKQTLDSSVSNEASHPRQRIVNVPDIPINVPPDVTKEPQNEFTDDFSSKEEALQKGIPAAVPQHTGSINGTLTNSGTIKENQDILTGKEAHAPSWLQLAQQRREMREQRERLLLGGSPNSFMDASNKPSRSSKVWDMVNNFQKLQMT